MLFCVNFGTHHEFDRRLIYNNLGDYIQLYTTTKK